MEKQTLNAIKRIWKLEPSTSLLNKESQLLEVFEGFRGLAACGLTPQEAVKELGQLVSFYEKEEKVICSQS